MDEQQAQAIKSKKKTTASSDEDRWKQIYQILFPKATNIPSPCMALNFRRCCDFCWIQADYEDLDLQDVDKNDSQRLRIERFTTWLDDRGKEQLKRILSDEIPSLSLSPESQECMDRVLERASQAYKTLTADFFKGRELPDSDLCIPFRNPANTSSASLGYGLAQFEWNNSSTRHIETSTQGSLCLTSLTLPPSSVSTDFTMATCVDPYWYLDPFNEYMANSALSGVFKLWGSESHFRGYYSSEDTKSFPLE
jgi:hypothetical protein